MKKVCSKTAVRIFVLTLIIPGSVLLAEDPPPAQDQAVQQAQSVAAMPVLPALHQALASSLGKATSIGAKAIPTPPTGSWGIVSEGDGGGGIFRDSDSDAEAWLGAEQVGVHGFGALAGGHFADSVDSGEAWVGHWHLGIEARGSEMGGYFEDSDGSGFAHLGWGNTGVFGRGNIAGGVFDDGDGSGYARAGYGDRGVDAGGSEMGGYFADSDGTAHALVGHGDWGIEAHGNVAGGYFKDKDGGTGVAYLGHADYGIEARGTEMGGYFEDSDGSGFAHLGWGNTGVFGRGNVAGGSFDDGDGSGYARAGYGDRGVDAGGSEMGGYFEDSDESGYAYVGYGDLGIAAYGSEKGGYFVDFDGSGQASLAVGDYGLFASGNTMGGSFTDIDSSEFSWVADGTYKIFGTGSVAFVQNHPYEPSSVIVYNAPEGDEVATYTRGTAQLVNGEATVPLGETFKWVTNPDLGLTAYLTPVGEWCDLYVVEKATNEITVRSRDGSDCAFDYLVFGLRIGFEVSSIVKEKEQESYIPSMSSHRQLYERRPDLKSYNSLERFMGMHHAINPKAKIDLSRAEALRDAIIEFDPAVHELPIPPGHEERPPNDPASAEAQRGPAHAHERVNAARGDHQRQPANDQADLRAGIPMEDDGNVYTPSFRPSTQDLASLVDVSEEVQPGDVLVIDRDNPGMMRKAFEAHDTGVIGVVALDAGDVAGTQPPATEVIEEGTAPSHRAAVGLAGVVTCNVDAAFGAVWPGDFLVTSPTPGHAMRTDLPLPGTTLGKALEPLQEGVGTIKVFVMLR